jgi:hypothetical protein
MNIKLLIFLFLTASVQAYAQTNDLKGERKIIKLDNIKHEARFYIYEPAFMASKQYKTREEATYRWPEEVFISLVSATNQEWLDDIELGGNAQKLPEDHLQNIQNAPADAVYFELKSKLTLFLGDVETAIIKFYFHSPDNVSSGAYLFQKIKNRWYKTNMTALTGLSIVLMRMKEDKLQDILTQNTSDPLTADLIKQVRNTDNTINLDILEKKFNSWYSNKDQKTIDYFIDPKAW